MRRRRHLPLRALLAPVVIVSLRAAPGAERDRTDRTDRTDLSDRSDPSDLPDAPPGLPAIEQLKAEELAAAQALVEAWPEDPSAIGILGNVHLNQGRQAEAVACRERALKLSPEAATGYCAMAEVAFLQEDHDRAVALWEKAAAIDPQLRGVRRRLGETYLLLGRPDRADSIEVRWIAGGTDRFTAVPAVQRVALYQGTGNAHAHAIGSHR